MVWGSQPPAAIAALVSVVPVLTDGLDAPRRTDSDVRKTPLVA